MLKMHHLDLANLIKDVELIAVSTVDNLSRVFSKLGVRSRYIKADKYTPTRSGKIWKAEMKYLISGLERSLDKLKAIVAKLEILA